MGAQNPSPFIFGPTGGQSLTPTEQANSFINGYTTTPTAAGTTTLTVASTQQQYFTGTTTQTALLPVVSTLVLGQSFSFTNLSTGVVTVQSSGANVVLAQGAGVTAVYTCILITGTTAASWNVTTINASVTGGDIQPSSFAASNNISSAANITGLLFASASVGSFQALVQVLVSASTNLRQTFSLKGTLNGAGTWQMTQTTNGDESGFVFTITSAGQVTYTNSNYTGFTAATVRFRAEVLGI